MSDRQKSADQLREEERVTRYLTQHPEFFAQHPDILENLSLPHDSGSAVSLVERQVSVLRQRNVDLRHRLNELLARAKDNDQLFERTRHLTLSLLDTRSVKELAQVLIADLKDRFDIPSVNLLLFAEIGQEQAPAIQTSEIDAQVHIGIVLNSTKPVCGLMRAEEIAFLFPGQSKSVGSVAAVRLGGKKPLGILALGHPDPHYYTKASGTLFLGYLSDILARLIPRLP